jgi:hypothetical protein
VEHGSTSPDSHARRDAVEHAEPDTVVRVGPEENGFYVEDDGPGIPSASIGTCSFRTKSGPEAAARN